VLHLCLVAWPLLYGTIPPALQTTQVSTHCQSHTNTSVHTLSISTHEAPVLLACLPACLAAYLPGSPVVPGKGLLQCHIYDHISAGMSALFNVKNLGTLVAPPTAKVLSTRSWCRHLQACLPGDSLYRAVYTPLWQDLHLPCFCCLLPAALLSGTHLLHCGGANRMGLCATWI
jgi:hypothetical protein